MKILVTGATSGLGRNLTEALATTNHSIIATGRNSQVGDLLNHKGIEFVVADLSDALSVQALCHRAEAIIHCAALSSPWGRYTDFYQSNVIATQNLLNAALKNGVKRFIHISTPSLYFDYHEKHNIQENDPLPKRFANHYAATKYLAEQAVDQAYLTKGLPVITLRPRAIFGPHDRTLMPRLIRLAQKSAVPLINEGLTLMDVTYVGNVVDSIMLCLKAEASCFGKKYNITNGEPMLLKDLLTQLFEILELPFNPKALPYGLAYSVASLSEFLSKLSGFRFEPPLTRYGAGVLAFGQTLDITAARSDLGYSPKTTIQQGLVLYRNWLKEHYDDLSQL